jgi:CDP-diacylglycerol--glycerol-3-phosphate 3-phosphatidyltransferase
MTTFLTTGLLVNKKSYKTFYYQPGLAERSEGFIFLTLMIIFKNYIFPISLLFSALIFITFIQRLFEAIKYLGSD